MGAAESLQEQRELQRLRQGPGERKSMADGHWPFDCNGLLEIVEGICKTVYTYTYIPDIQYQCSIGIYIYTPRA